MSKTIPAIILSANTIALGIVRALGKRGVPLVVVHYDPSDIAHRSHYASKTLTTPHPEKDEEGFIDRLMGLPSEWKGAVIMPASDETLLVAARNKERLSRHFRVACPDYATVRQVVDKQQTYPLAAAVGVTIPRTLAPQLLADALLPDAQLQDLLGDDDGRTCRTLVPQSLADVQNFCNEMRFPCLLKPSQSHLFHARFGTKMFFVENPKQLLVGYQRATKAGLEVMIQEYIHGDDGAVANYNSYSVGGKPLVEFTADHIRSAPPWFGSPRVVRSRKIDELFEPGRRMLQALNYTGYACMEFKQDARDGEYKLMEVNGRHNLSTLLAVRCGINFPWLEYRHQAYGDLPQAQTFQSGVYWIDLARDIAYSLKHHRDEGYALSDYSKPYLQPHTWAICDWRDPLPFLNRISNLAGELMQGKVRASSPSGLLTREALATLRGLPQQAEP